MARERASGAKKHKRGGTNAVRILRTSASKVAEMTEFLSTDCQKALKEYAVMDSDKQKASTSDWKELRDALKKLSKSVEVCSSFFG